MTRLRSRKTWKHVFKGCVMGWQVTYDCKAHGFARCGKNAKNIVTCVY